MLVPDLQAPLAPAFRIPVLVDDLVQVSGLIACQTHRHSARVLDVELGAVGCGIVTALWVVEFLFQN